MGWTGGELGSGRVMGNDAMETVAPKGWVTMPILRGMALPVDAVLQGGMHSPKRRPETC
jgi:hypothetical protein